MTSRLSLLFTTTALTVMIGLPALAAMQTRNDEPAACTGACVTELRADDGDLPLIRVSGDDDEGEGGWFGRGGDDDDDDDEGDDDEDDDCDDDDCAASGGRGNPAPAGTVPPPANGLFGNGAPPVAVTN